MRGQYVSKHDPCLVVDAIAGARKPSARCKFKVSIHRLSGVANAASFATLAIKAPCSFEQRAERVLGALCGFRESIGWANPG